MKMIKKHLRVMPPLYELSISGAIQGYWCKLGEVYEIIPTLTEVAEISFSPTPEDLISRFAALTRPNREPMDMPEKERKKFFRYSLDGTSLGAKEMPSVSLRTAPPYAKFTLDIPAPYPLDMFVKDVWAKDTLRAIRLGAVAAADWGGDMVCFRPDSAAPGESCFSLYRKSGDMILGRVPACVK